MERQSFAMENYLEAVYELSADNMGARISDIAERLNVSKASTNSAMATLSEKGLITNEKYGEIFLTPAGREVAQTTSNKHHTIQRFFTSVLGLDFDTADTDACAIEHVISADAIRAMQAYMRSHRGEPKKP